MKKIIITSLLLSFVILLSACTFPGFSPKVEVTTNPSVTPSVTETPTPTVSKETTVDSIEADLKATTILDEDFSDIK